MTHELNIIAAAIDLMIATERHDEYLARPGRDAATCDRMAKAQADAQQYLVQSLIAAGLNWRDPAVRKRLYRGEVADILSAS